MTYYLISDIETGAERFVIRIRPGYAERWDAESREWVHDNSLYAYPFNGEPGAVEITPDRAREIAGEDAMAPVPM